MDFLLRGLVIGLAFGVPVGAVGALTVQRAYAGGFRAGMLSGLGSSAADCLYAAIGAFGLTMISEALLRWQNWIRLGGGAMIVAMGIALMTRKPQSAEATISDTAHGIQMLFSSFFIGLTNPAAIITFLLAFSTFGISVQTKWDGLGLIAGVGIGTTVWWAVLSGVVTSLKGKAGSRILPVLNRVCGILMLLFGCMMFFQKG